MGTSTTKSKRASKSNTQQTVPLTPANAVGRIIKIKDDAKAFCGGHAIQDWVREAELFISRMPSDGVIVVGNSESRQDIDVLLLKDAIVTDEYRQPRDSGVDFDNISVRIFGVPSRMECIKENQKRLGLSDEFIFIDENRDGCIPTAKRAWSYPTDKEFTLVLQDDIELCDDFASVCNRIVKAHPNAVISLFSLQLLSRHALYGRTKQLTSPYIAAKAEGVSGQGIILRTEWVEECLAAWGTSGLNGDDTNIGAWAQKTGKSILTTIPMPIQHLGVQSVFNPGRVLGGSDFYSKFAVKADWENPYATSVTNLIR